MGNETFSNNDVSLLNKYKNAISEFENYYLKDIYYNNYSFNSSHKGYLIDLKDYERIIQLINNINININNVNIKDLKKNFEINQIEFKTSHYLINMILNGNKYIFINTKLWQLLYDKEKNNDSPIIYNVNSNDITFSLLDKTTLSFKHNKNIIDENSYKDNYYRSNYKQITNIYNSITYYYIFENKIMNDLKNIQSSKDIDYVFLISKNWIEIWKKISYYENIKINYLQKNLNNKNEIINVLIYYLENNNIKYNKLFESINILKFNKKEDFESYLRKD